MADDQNAFSADLQQSNLNRAMSALTEPDPVDVASPTGASAQEEEEIKADDNPDLEGEEEENQQDSSSSAQPSPPAPSLEQPAAVETPAVMQPAAAQGVSAPVKEPSLNDLKKQYQQRQERLKQLRAENDALEHPKPKEPVGPNITAMVGKAAQNAWDATTGAAQNIGNAASQIGQGIGESIGTRAQALGHAVNYLGQAPGHHIAGIGEGFIDQADAIGGLMKTAAGRFNPSLDYEPNAEGKLVDVQAQPLPKPEETLGKKYEQMLGPQVTEDPAYKAGHVLGDLTGGIVAGGLTAGVAATAGLPTAAAAGAGMLGSAILYGAGEAANRAFEQGHKVNPSELAWGGSTAFMFPHGLETGARLLGAGIGSLIGASRAGSQFWNQTIADALNMAMESPSMQRSMQVIARERAKLLEGMNAANQALEVAKFAQIDKNAADAMANVPEAPALFRLWEQSLIEADEYVPQWLKEENASRLLLDIFKEKGALTDLTEDALEALKTVEKSVGSKDLGVIINALKERADRSEKHQYQRELREAGDWLRRKFENHVSRMQEKGKTPKSLAEFATTEAELLKAEGNRAARHVNRIAENARYAEYYHDALDAGETPVSQAEFESPSKTRLEGKVEKSPEPSEPKYKKYYDYQRVKEKLAKQIADRQQAEEVATSEPANEAEPPLTETRDRPSLDETEKPIEEEQPEPASIAEELPKEPEQAAEPEEPEAEEEWEEPPLFEPSELGEYRLNRSGKGFELLGYAKSIDDPIWEKKLGPQLHAQLKSSLVKIGTTRAAVADALNDEYAQIQNVLKLAPEDAADIRQNTEVELNSTAKAEYDKKRSELFEKQAREHKELQDQFDAIVSDLEVHAQKLKAAPKVLKRSIKKDIEDLKNDLEVIEEMLRLRAPQDDAVQTGANKYLTTLMDNLALNDSAGRELPTTYPEALKRAQLATVKRKLLVEADKAAKKEVAPVFDVAATTLGEPLKGRLWVKVEVPHPANPEIKTPFAAGMSFNPRTPSLIKPYEREARDYKATLLNKQENTNKSILYEVGGLDVLEKLPQKDIIQKLQDEGMLHENTKKVLLGTAFGLSAMILSDALPAEAADGSDFEKHDPMRPIAQFALGTAILVAASKYGWPAAWRLAQKPLTRAVAHLNDTLDWLQIADAALAKAYGVPLTPGMAISNHMKRLGGKIEETRVKLKGNKSDGYLAWKCAAYGLTDDEFNHASKAAQPVLQDLEDHVKRFRSDFTLFASDFRKAYKGMKPSQQHDLKGAMDAVDYVDDNYQKDGIGARNSIFDRLVYHWQAKAMKGLFWANPNIHVKILSGPSVELPLQVGNSAAARAQALLLASKAVMPIRKLQGKASIADLADQLWIPDPHSDSVMRAALKVGAPGKARNVAPGYAMGYKARAAMIGSLLKTKDETPAIQKLFSKGLEGDAQWVASILGDPDSLPQDIVADAFQQLYVDNARVIGDSSGLIRGWVGRGLVKNYLSFVANDLERHTRLIMTNIVKGNTKKLVGSMAMQMQFGGSAALPLSLKAVGYTFDHEDTLALMDLMDLLSVGQNTLGNMTHYFEWDPILYPLVGAPLIAVAMLSDFAGSFPQACADILTCMKATANGMGAFTGDPRDPVNEAAQKAANRLGYRLQLILPIARIARAALAGIPTLQAGVAEVGVPGLLPFGHQFPIERAKLRTIQPITGSPLVDDVGQLIKSAGLLPREYNVNESEFAQLEKEVRQAVSDYTGGAFGMTPEAYETALANIHKIAGLHETAPIQHYQKAKHLQRAEKMFGEEKSDFAKTMQEQAGLR